LIPDAHAAVQVRLLCDQGDFSAARERVDGSGDDAAAFYLARRLEGQDRVPEAIQLYGVARQFAHGAALAKRMGLDAVRNGRRGCGRGQETRARTAPPLLWA